jgi:DNA-binding NtrC family response regulator
LALIIICDAKRAVALGIRELARATSLPIQVESAASTNNALPWAALATAQAVYLSCRPGDVVERMSEWARRSIPAQLIVELQHANAEDVVSALHAGAVDVLLCPPDRRRLHEALYRAGLAPLEGEPLASVLEHLSSADVPAFTRAGTQVQ